MYQRDMTFSTGLVSVATHLEGVLGLPATGRISPERIATVPNWMDDLDMLRSWSRRSSSRTHHGRRAEPASEPDSAIRSVMAWAALPSLIRSALVNGSTT